MSTSTVHGAQPKLHSHTIEHFYSYPLVSDIISMYQQNSLGAKSIEIFHSLYGSFVAPVTPYLQTPYSMVAPYLERADSFGDNTLSTADNYFPALKETDYSSLKGHASYVAGYPFKIAGDGRSYLVNTYNDEYKKIGGDGFATTGKAVISTELRIASEAMHAVADFLGPKKAEAEKKFEQLKKTAGEKVGHAKKTVGEQVHHN